MSQAGSFINAGDTVTSITGVSPITANGVSGSAQTGAVSVGISNTSYISTLDGDSGSATPSSGVVSIIANVASGNCGSSVSITGSSHTLTLNVTDSKDNTLIGISSGNGSVSGESNTGVGRLSLNSLSSSSSNVAFGINALGSLSSGSGFNSAFGQNAGNALFTGSFNILLGQDAGGLYVGAESSNICIGNQGVVGESNVIRIGNQGTGSGEENLCYIAGITGATPSSAHTPQVVLCDSQGNLAPISSSTSGYVLTSNGSSTPSFQAVPNTAITTIDGDSGSVTGATVTFTGGTSGAVFTGSSTTMTLSFSEIKFTTDYGVIGITDGSSAPSLSVGQLLSQVIPSVSPQNPTSGSFNNLCAINVPAGDWDIWGSISVTVNDDETIVALTAGISNTSVTLPDASTQCSLNNPVGESPSMAFAVPMIPYTNSGLETWYLVYQAISTGGTIAVCGSIFARRRR